MYHIELRQFPHNTCRFNLTEQELRAVLGPWAREQFVEVGERKWSPHQAKLTILEGPRLEVQQLAMGRGWRAAQRQSEDVTEGVLAQARQANATPGAQTAGVEQLLPLLGADPEALLQAWRLTAERRAELSPSESLALAESTLRSLDGT
jgi:hypothetical protein